MAEIDAADDSKPVTLGPACAVLFLMGALALAVSLVIASWMLMGNQPAMAARAIEEQMIPWVNQSVLAPDDRSEILEELRQLAEQIRTTPPDDRKLLRLKMRIADSPVLQWGTMQILAQKIAQSGLTEEEKQAAVRTNQRLLRAASEGTLGIQQLEFIVQHVTRKEVLSGRLVNLENPSDADLREFLRRGEAFSDTAKISGDPFSKSPAQVFHDLILDALNPPER